MKPVANYIWILFLVCAFMIGVSAIHQGTMSFLFSHPQYDYKNIRFVQFIISVLWGAGIFLIFSLKKRLKANSNIFLIVLISSSFLFSYIVTTVLHFLISKNPWYNLLFPVAILAGFCLGLLCTRFLKGKSSFFFVALAYSTIFTAALFTVLELEFVSPPFGRDRNLWAIFIFICIIFSSLLTAWAWSNLKYLLPRPRPWCRPNWVKISIGILILYIAKGYFSNKGAVRNELGELTQLFFFVLHIVGANVLISGILETWYFKICKPSHEHLDWILPIVFCVSIATCASIATINYEFVFGLLIRSIPPIVIGFSMGIVCARYLSPWRIEQIRWHILGTIFVLLTITCSDWLDWDWLRWSKVPQIIYSSLSFGLSAFLISWRLALRKRQSA